MKHARGLTAVAAPVILAVAMAAAGPAHTAVHTVATPVRPTASLSVRSVTLVTGERVVITDAGGRTSYSAGAGGGERTAFESFQTRSGDHYLVPSEAVPYLGTRLDPSLFDVSAMLRDGMVTGAKLPVKLSFASGATRSAPAGVTLTSTSGTSAQGYVTPRSGAAFAAALRSGIGADVRAHRRTGSGPLSGGLATMSLALPAAAPAAPTPDAAAGVRDSALHTLRFEVTDLSGAPTDNAGGVLMNTDSFSLFDGSVTTSGGVAAVSVPAGDYCADFAYYDFGADGNPTALRIVALTDFTVSADTPTTTVAVDERTADVPLTFSTPKPATESGEMVFADRWDSTGALGGGFYWDPTGTLPFYTDSQPAAQIGKQRYIVYWFADGTDAAGQSYRYDLTYASDDIPADQAHQATPADLATVHDELYTDPGNPSGATAFGSDFAIGPYDAPSGNFSLIIGVHPYKGELTDYVGGADGGQWTQSYITSSYAQEFADVHTFAPGGTYEQQWGRGPLAPTVGQHTGPTTDFACAGCASAGAMRLSFGYLGDSEPDHVGLPLVSTTPGFEHYAVYQGGNIVFKGDDVQGAELTDIPSTPTTYREVFDTSIADPQSGATQDTATHTEISFVYRPNSNSDDILPAEDACSFDGTVSAPCQILPLLDLDYSLAADMTNTSHSLVQTMALHVGHLSYDGRGSQAAITSASVAVSFDAGTTWLPASLTGAAGRYAAVWANPVSAAGTSPALRVTATDADGGSITQTITAAYTIGG